MKSLLTIGLLILSNVFMTLAWYGHLKFKELKWFENAGLITIILISWGLALFEYCFQVPANKIGFQGNGVFFVNATKNYTRSNYTGRFCYFFPSFFQK